MKRPDILYKYSSLEPRSRDHALTAIRSGEVWFSSVSQFNDPFEARVRVSMDGDDGDWFREFGRHRPDTSSIERMIPEFEQGVRQDVEQVGLFCLAAKSDDILMWSHYADCHRGFCIGFRTTNDSILCDAQPVEYGNDYPVVDYFRMTREQRTRAMVLRKALHWQYEQEWRVVRVGQPGLAKYPHGMLTSVILGCEITQTDREAVLEAVSVLPVELYQAQRHESDYALDLMRVNTTSNHGLQQTPTASRSVGAAEA